MYVSEIKAHEQHECTRVLFLLQFDTNNIYMYSSLYPHTWKLLVRSQCIFKFSDIL